MFEPFDPFYHQRLASDHLKATDEALLFAGMGLGKTAAVLDAADWCFADGSMKGLLIVAPLRVSVLTWPDEVAKWPAFRYMRCVSLRTNEGKKAWAEGSAHVYTINYEALPRFVRENFKGKRASELPVDAVLFDEVDNAKNPSSKRIRVFRQFARPKMTRAWGMTGTPVSNSRRDLFAQVRLIDQGKTFGTAYGKWERQFFEPENYYSDYPKMVLRPGSEELLEQRIAHLALVLRSEDYLDIPPTTTTDIAVAVPREVKTRYRRFEKELLEVLDDGAELIAPNAAVLVNKLLQIASGAVYVREGDADDPNTTRRVEVVHTAKLDALRKLHDDIDREPLLVACWYQHEVERILAAFPYARRFDDDAYTAWNRGEVPMLVAHPKSIGHGLNLQDGGRSVCWFSLWHSRGLYDQLNARLARTGQTRETRVFRLIWPGSVDDAVAESLRDKGDDQSAFLATLNNIKRLVAAV